MRGVCASLWSTVHFVQEMKTITGKYKPHILNNSVEESSGCGFVSLRALK